MCFLSYVSIIVNALIGYLLYKNKLNTIHHKTNNFETFTHESQPLSIGYYE